MSHLPFNFPFEVKNIFFLINTLQFCVESSKLDGFDFEFNLIEETLQTQVWWKISMPGLPPFTWLFPFVQSSNSPSRFIHSNLIFPHVQRLIQGFPPSFVENKLCISENVERVQLALDPLYTKVLIRLGQQATEISLTNQFQSARHSAVKDFATFHIKSAFQAFSQFDPHIVHDIVREFLAESVMET